MRQLYILSITNNNKLGEIRMRHWKIRWYTVVLLSVSGGTRSCYNREKIIFSLSKNHVSLPAQGGNWNKDYGFCFAWIVQKRMWIRRSFMSPETLRMLNIRYRFITFNPGKEFVTINNSHIQTNMASAHRKMETYNICSVIK